MYIGAHLPISDGYLSAIETAIDIGGNTLQFFTRNPRGGRVKKIDLEDMALADELCKKENIPVIIAHAPYTYNLASKEIRTWNFAVTMLREDIDRLNLLETCKYLVLHPGSHVGEGEEAGIKRIIEGLNLVLKKDDRVMILLETMAGRGTEIGYKFEDLIEIINNVENNHLLGVCLDSCHTYSAGYDIVDNLDKVLIEFDNIVWLDRLKCVHLNDSMCEFKSRKDRHARIGEGYIGLDGILNLINHPRLKGLPFILETPNELDGYAKEIKIIKYGVDYV